MPDKTPRDKSGHSKIPDQFTLAGGRICESGPKIPPLVFTRIQSEKGNVYQANLSDPGHERAR